MAQRLAPLAQLAEQLTLNQESKKPTPDNPRTNRTKPTLQGPGGPSFYPSVYKRGNEGLGCALGVLLGAAFWLGVLVGWIAHIAIRGG